MFNRVVIYGVDSSGNPIAMPVNAEEAEGGSVSFAGLQGFESNHVGGGQWRRLNAAVWDDLQQVDGGSDYGIIVYNSPFMYDYDEDDFVAPNAYWGDNDYLLTRKPAYFSNSRTLLYDEEEDSYTRARSNYNTVPLAASARTASINSSDLTNYNGRGVHVVIKTTAITGSPSVVPTIQGKTGNGDYYDLLSGAAITGAGTIVLKLYPGITVAANLSVSDILPRTFRVIMAHGNADSITYSVSVSVIN